MNLQDVAFLTSSAGIRWLAELTNAGISPHNHIRWATRLRSEVGTQFAHALLETALLRQKAAAKFSRASQMLFVRPALEQASAEKMGMYRAGIFADQQFKTILELGCGIGGDSLALNQMGQVVGVEQDELRLAMAVHNVGVYEPSHLFHPLSQDFLTLKLTDLPIAPQAIFCDPARRDEQGRRIFDLNRYQPAVPAILAHWQKKIPHLAIKISPSADYAQFPADAEIEFISLDGELREGVLWLGELRRGAKRRATVLPSGWTVNSQEMPAHPIPITLPQAYLYEPDPAIIRAHLVEALAQQLQASKIDPDIAYLTAPHAQSTPASRCFAIETFFPFQLKRLRHYLQQHKVGYVTIKKRGSPLETEQLRQLLHLKGDHHRTLFLTHLQGVPSVIISAS